MSILSADTGSAEKAGVPKSAHVLCGWPLIMVFFGGAIGGGLGGGAYGLNLLIYKSRLPVPAKIVLNILTGITAVVTWVIIAGLIQSLRK